MYEIRTSHGDPLIPQHLLCARHWARPDRDKQTRPSPCEAQSPVKMEIRHEVKYVV